MKIDMRYRLERAISTDESRAKPASISVTRRLAIVSDGKIIATVPVEVEEEDKAG